MATGWVIRREVFATASTTMPVGGSQTVDLFTVPTGRRYVITEFHSQVTASNDNTQTTAYKTTKSGGSPSMTMATGTATTATTPTVQSGFEKMIFEAGDKLQYVVTGAFTKTATSLHSITILDYTV